MLESTFINQRCQPKFQGIRWLGQKIRLFCGSVLTLIRICLRRKDREVSSRSLKNSRYVIVIIHWKMCVIWMKLQFFKTWSQIKLVKKRLFVYAQPILKRIASQQCCIVLQQESCCHLPSFSSSLAKSDYSIWGCLYCLDG